MLRKDLVMVDPRISVKQCKKLVLLSMSLLLIVLILRLMTNNSSVKTPKMEVTKEISTNTTSSFVTSNDLKTYKLNYAKAPDDNPLKGFIGLAGAASYTDFPSSMEFVIVPVSEMVVGKDQYDWTGLDKRISDVTAYGRQAVLSFYMDYPGSAIGKNAIPQYLLDSGLKLYEYDSYAGGFSPDYSNQELWEMLYNFVRVLGERYDGDARIAQIETSLVGIWGEWHTHPYTNFGLETEQLVELAKVYDASFKYTQISFRYPFDGMQGLDGGYSDYSFCSESIVADWSQLNRLKSVGLTKQWMKNMCGGELIPQFRDEIFETKDWCLKEGESYLECLQALHPSWLFVGNLASFTLDERKAAIEAANMLGYEFYIPSVTYQPYLKKGTTSLDLSVNIKNIGAAPFYYDWPVDIEILNSNNQVVTKYSTDWDITKIAADKKAVKFETTIPIKYIKSGIYTIALRIKNPISNGNPIRFANETQHKDGYMMLGQFAYDSTAKISNSLVQQDPNDTFVETYGYGISSSYLRDQIPKGHVYTFGIRLRKYSTDATITDYPMVIRLYKDNKLVRTIQTDWSLNKIKGDTAYFAWNAKLKNPGEYVMKIKVASTLKEIEIGHLIVK